MEDKLEPTMISGIGTTNHRGSWSTWCRDTEGVFDAITDSPTITHRDGGRRWPGGSRLRSSNLETLKVIPNPAYLIPSGVTWTDRIAATPAKHVPRNQIRAIFSSGFTASLGNWRKWRTQKWCRKTKGNVLTDTTHPEPFGARISCYSVSAFAFFTIKIWIWYQKLKQVTFDVSCYILWITRAIATPTWIACIILKIEKYF